MTGFFLTVEGPEGAGKSTLVAALAERLRSHGVDPVVVREPGGTPVAEAARRLLLDSAGPVSPATELFLLLAARSDLVAGVVRPGLTAGRLILADRFELSTLAYQVGGRGLPRAAVLEANRLATGGLVPDLVLVLDVPGEVGLERVRRSGKVLDRMEREAADFHRRVAESFRVASGPGLVHLDAQRPAAAVLTEAWAAVVRAMGNIPGLGRLT